MRFTINWLKQHLETDASDEEICQKLTDIGLELEEFEDVQLQSELSYAIAYREVTRNIT